MIGDGSNALFKNPGFLGVAEIPIARILAVDETSTGLRLTSQILRICSHTPSRL